MEEKWWSKFQNKSSNENPNQEVNDNKEVSETNDTLDSAINFIQDLSDKIENKVDSAMNDEHFNSFTENISETADNFMNSSEVQEATDKAREVMENIANEVSSWSNEEASIDNPIVKDFDNVKQAVSNALSTKQVQNAYSTVMNGIDDVSDKVKEVWDSPEVQSKYEYVKDKVNEQLEKEKVQETINYVKEKTDDAKKWAFEVYNRDDVQEGVSKIKEVSSDLVETTKGGFTKLINNPDVQNGYTAMKDGTVRAGKTIKLGVTDTFNDVKHSEGLKREFTDWKESAWTFTKQSGRVIAATAIEIKNNENVQKAVKETGKFLRNTAAHALHSAEDWWNRTHGVQFLEHKEEDHKEE